MEAITDTPVKEKLKDGTPMSPVYKTPSRKCCISQVDSGSHSSFFTPPPSGLTRFIVRNPFEADMTSRLHLSLISPSIFKKTTPKSQGSPFAWTIDELAELKPVEIEEFPIQQICTPDPDVESKAQDAIKMFFSQKSIQPSPWDEKREPTKPLISITPTRSRVIDNNESQTLTKTCGVQTVLSLPPVLPKHVEDILKPYLTGVPENDEVDCSNNSSNSSNNSLRRKLFANNSDDDEDSDEETSEIIQFTSTSSPPQSGMMIHGTPIGKSIQVTQRTHGTPYLNSNNLSPPDMSPIFSTSNDGSYRGFGRRCRPRFNLSANFSPMSVDKSLMEAKSNDNPFNFEGIKRTNLLKDINSDEKTRDSEQVSINETVEMASILQDLTPVKRECNDSEDSIDGLANYSDKGNINSTIIGYSEWSAYNSVQDTGYQTSSMNNTSNLNNRNSIIAVNKALNWNERQVNGVNGITNVDEFSDWQKNIRDRCSTPSKFMKLKEVE